MPSSPWSVPGRRPHSAPYHASGQSRCRSRTRSALAKQQAGRRHRVSGWVLPRVSFHEAARPHETRVMATRPPLDGPSVERWLLPTVRGVPRSMRIVGGQRSRGQGRQSHAGHTQERHAHGGEEGRGEADGRHNVTLAAQCIVSTMPQWGESASTSVRDPQRCIASKQAASRGASSVMSVWEFARCECAQLFGPRTGNVVGKHSSRGATWTAGGDTVAYATLKSMRADVGIQRTGKEKMSELG